jgi:phosphorylase/glycogen(starch) synthase
VLVPNGLDLAVVDQLAAGDRAATRAAVARLARAFLGEEVGDATFLALAGRYEFHNKGIELLLDALGRMQTTVGRRMVAFLLVPAGNSGMRSELLERLNGADAKTPIGVCTHNVFDEARDPVQAHCKSLGLDNRHGSRVKVVQIPIYLRPDDGVFAREYEAVLAGMDLGVYPSFYEPWGYTPQEALAVGVPTITTDLAGFGRWAIQEGLGTADGITVLKRQRVPYADVTGALVDALEGFADRNGDGDALRRRCRQAAGRTAWKDLFANYERAYALANAAVQQRSTAGIVQFRLPRRALPSPGSGTTPRLSTFEAAATVPPSLRGLDRLARNFWWSWNPGVVELFLALAPAFGPEGENPVRCLQRAGLDVLQRLASDPGYLARLQQVVERFERYLAAAPKSMPVVEGGPAIDGKHPIAYFSAEFGVHPSLPIYSGGLGILAGDHLKSASDLGVPLCGVGLFYR